MQPSFDPFTTDTDVLTGKVSGPAVDFCPTVTKSLSHPNVDQKFELKMDCTAANGQKTCSIFDHVTIVTISLHEFP